METTALVWTAAIVGAGMVYWFMWVMGAADVKGMQAVDLKMGSNTNDKVHNKYWSFFRRPKETVEVSEEVPDLVGGTIYNLVTDIYEWGWGQSFHFSPSIRGKSHRDAARKHEERIVDLIRARPGQKILDIGCGVGGPMRAIAAKSGSNVVGININEYQVDRARADNKKAGMDSNCEVVCGSFLQMPFEDDSFNGAYSIEATCHATKLEEVYADIYRVLKPGGLYVSYESVTTELYKADEQEHVETIHGIEKGGLLPKLRAYNEISEVAKKVGFEVVEEKDLAKPPAGPWWTRVKMGRIAYWRNHLLATVMSFLRIAPKEVVEVHEMLWEMALHLSKGGEAGIFSPMYMICCRKPLPSEE